MTQLPSITDFVATVEGLPGDPLPGWYFDSLTGEWVYYDQYTRQWFIQQDGILVPLAIDRYPATNVNPNAPIAIGPGDKIKIDMSYKYSGPAITNVEEYFSIGYEILTVYTPKVKDYNYRNLPTSSTPLPYTSTKTLTIPSDVGSNWTMIEAKVWRGTPSVPEKGWQLYNAFKIAGIVPDITEFKIISFNKV